MRARPIATMPLFAALERAESPKPAAVPFAVATGFQPSRYQQAIFDWIVGGKGNAAVEAVAGSGKSTTAVEASKYTTGTAMFLAFNTHIVEELKRKLGGRMDCRTIHGLGFGCIARAYGKPVVSDKKYRDLIANEWKGLCGKFGWSLDSKDAKELRDCLTQLCRFCRVCLVSPNDPEAFIELVDHYDIDGFDYDRADDYRNALARILEKGREAASKIIDFTDMIWIPVVEKLRTPQFQWIFVDEAQDLSRCQLELVLRCQADGGRILAIGDGKQAIMGFAGADSEAFERVAKLTRATRLPLSICYRCPSSHLDLAREIVPQIQPRPNAPRGEIETIHVNQLSSRVRPGDLIVSRKTAPLIVQCLSIIASGIPARVRGRDIAAGLTKIVKQIASSHFPWAEFPKALEDTQAERLEKLARRPDNEQAIQDFRDRVQCIWVCFENFKANSYDGFCTRIESLFDDNQASVWLSTIHRAKGLEADRVFILDPASLPLRFASQRAWELEQEMNLRYVALTRARQSMFFVETK